MARSSRKTRRKKNTGIGYGRPPVEHRFKPGRSGNPRGRPKTLPHLSELATKELRRRGRVTIDGKQQTITRLELLVKQLIANAAKGNTKALNFLLELERQAQIKDRKREFLDRGATIHESMSAKEAMEEWQRYLEESNRLFREEQE
jgi:Family of unknown function (DUF5681)